ncbi:MAG TPA: NAD-dependent epimerase/dehydratase family protein [Myxococcales bacterium]|nr:NAD-dependent epimerase/dehydratase family protein [Myxococcales bacterium]HIN86935.1 NAD-dependent epimerase/dehydratase family protein [Myxococcales bacterium]
MKVLLTGATGFLGAAIVKELHERAVTVRALVRKSSNTQALEAANVERVVASLNPSHGLEEAVSNVDAVIHCAGGGWTRSTRGFYDNNTRTTENLLAAIKAKNPDISRFVLVSSLSAHGPCPDGTVRDPDSKPTPMTHYGRAKALAEEATLRHKELFPVTIIRPPAIYGPADVRLLPLFKSIARGFATLPSVGRSISVIHVNDCARAICDLALKEHPNGRRYFVEDGHRMSHTEMALSIGRAVGRKPRIIPIPKWLLWIAAFFSELTSRVLNRSALLTRDKAKDLSQPHWICDATPLRSELGWMPQVTFDQGAQQTAHWYREHKWLK